MKIFLLFLIGIMVFANTLSVANGEPGDYCATQDCPNRCKEACYATTLGWCYKNECYCLFI